MALVTLKLEEMNVALAVVVKSIKNVVCDNKENLRANWEGKFRLDKQDVAILQL